MLSLRKDGAAVTSPSPGAPVSSSAVHFFVPQFPPLQNALVMLSPLPAWDVTHSPPSTGGGGDTPKPRSPAVPREQPWWVAAVGLLPHARHDAPQDIPVPLPPPPVTALTRNPPRDRAWHGGEGGEVFNFSIFKRRMFMGPFFFFFFSKCPFPFFFIFYIIYRNSS